MNDKRRISANDIISGPPPHQDTESDEKPTQYQEDVKSPNGLHPVVADRLSRERTSQPLNALHETNIVPKGDYVTRDEMNRFVNDLNTQLAEISKCLNIVVQNDGTYKSAIMSMQGQISTLHSKVNAIYNRQ